MCFPFSVIRVPASRCPPITYGCSLAVGVDTSSYPALPIIFATFHLHLPDLDQASTERGGAMIYDGTCLVKVILVSSPSPSFFIL